MVISDSGLLFWATLYTPTPCVSLLCAYFCCLLYKAYTLFVSSKYSTVVSPCLICENYNADRNSHTNGSPSFRLAQHRLLYFVCDLRSSADTQQNRHIRISHFTCFACVAAKLFGYHFSFLYFCDYTRVIYISLYPLRFLLQLHLVGLLILCGIISTCDYVNFLRHANYI